MTVPAETVTLYGLKTCATMRKAGKWLTDHGVAWTLHDWRRDGVSEAFLQELVQKLSWEKLLNRSSTSWRNLPETEKTSLLAAEGPEVQEKALALMLATPALIRRPVLLTSDNRLLLRFSPDSYTAFFPERA